MGIDMLFRSNIARTSNKPARNSLGYLGLMLLSSALIFFSTATTAADDDDGVQL